MGDHKYEISILKGEVWA